MADKSVGELIAAQSVTPTDLFVLEQNGTAKKLTGQILENWLLSFADGHGGIQSIAKISTSGLADTYRITLADQTTFDFVVTNGRSVNSITKVSTSGLVDTYRIDYSDGKSSTFTVTNGAKGDKGDNAYMWIKYASQEPTDISHSFGDVPDAWIGVYFGNLSSAPADWQQYKWYQWKGEKGDTGDAATLMSATVTYQTSTSGTIVPSGSWQTNIPIVPPGSYLWTRTVYTFNTGAPVTQYSVARFGIDGTGSVSSVAGISPDANGDVPLTAENVGALPSAGGTMTGPINMNGQTLSGLNTPTVPDEAATKGYTDSQITGAKGYADLGILSKVIYSGGKNLLKNTARSQTVNGVTFTVNEDDSVTVNGTATSQAILVLNQNILPPGSYLVSSGVSDLSVVVEVRDADGIRKWYYGSNIPYNHTVSGAEQTIRYYLEVQSGKTVSNIRVYPMIRLASREDDSYEPYYRGLMELTSSMELLWENASPTSAFVAQDIHLDLAQYDTVKISVPNGGIYESPKGVTTTLFYAANKNFLRTATITDEYIRFSDGQATVTYGTWDMETDNTFMVPQKIYGVKGVSA